MLLDYYHSCSFCRILDLNIISSWNRMYLVLLVGGHACTGTLHEGIMAVSASSHVKVWSIKSSDRLSPVGGYVLIELIDGDNE